MIDIHENKGFLFGNIFSLESIYFLLFVVLLLFVYCLFIKYIKTNKATTKSEIREKEVNYKALLKNIETHYLKGKKEIFYAKLGELFRQFLDDKIEKDLSKKNLLEFKKQSSIKGKDNLINIYEKIYFPEYNNKKDDTSDRKNILKEIQKTINEYI